MMMNSCRSRRLLGKRASLICMLCLTSSLFLAEIITGYATNSTALIADSFHMLSDVMSICIGLGAVVVSKRESKYNTYGWARAEVLGALCNAVFLLALCFSIIVQALQRLVSVEKINNPILILIVGGAGLLVNLAGLLLFHGHTHHHHHGDEHHLEHGKSEDTEDVQPVMGGSQLNMKGVFLHVLGDALGSIVVLVSALIIQFVQDDWRYYVDPVMSLVIAIIIIYTTIPLLKLSGMILLQNPPPHVETDELLYKAKQVRGIQDMHELHIWQLSGNCVIASAHLTMHEGDNFYEAAKKVNKIFHDKGIHSLTLQPEFYDCREGRSLCGTASCNFLCHNDAGLSNNNDEGDPVPKSPSSDDFHQTESSCLLSCVSSECREFQCCSRGEKIRRSTTTSVMSSINYNGRGNEAFDPRCEDVVMETQEQDQACSSVENCVSNNGSQVVATTRNEMDVGLDVDYSTPL